MVCDDNLALSDKNELDLDLFTLYTATTCPKIPFLLHTGIGQIIWRCSTQDGHKHDKLSPMEWTGFEILQSHPSSIDIRTHTNSTRSSQAVSHSNTVLSRCCLNLVFVWGIKYGSQMLSAIPNISAGP